LYEEKVSKVLGKEDDFKIPILFSYYTVGKNFNKQFDSLKNTSKQGKGEVRLLKNMYNKGKELIDDV
jgi:hypothetical protein